MSSNKYMIDAMGNVTSLQIGGDGTIEKQTLIIKRPSQLILDFENPEFSGLAYETEIRKPVITFAKAMEERLREKDEEKGETGWLNRIVITTLDRSEIFNLWQEAQHHFAKLAVACSEGKVDGPTVARAAVDSANMCMMLFDAVGTYIKIKEIFPVIQETEQTAKALVAVQTSKGLPVNTDFGEVSWPSGHPCEEMGKCTQTPSIPYRPKYNKLYQCSDCMIQMCKLCATAHNLSCTNTP